MLDTIKSNDEISRIFSDGRRISGKYVTLIFVEKNCLDKMPHKHDLSGRVAFIAGKKNGGAVWRNSAKRRLREIYRSNLEVLNKVDALLIAKRSILQDPYTVVLRDFKNTVERINNDR